jgi:gliding motility-associated-like protein
MVLTGPNDLAMPTGFSPNGDGANDAFIIHGLDAYPANRLIIINRWGNVVFDRVNYRNDWTGEGMQGGPLPDGTYFARLTVNSGDRELQGYIDLRR